ncbi:hypothetical protein L798_08849 [Zootermopsis nevadensis]|uniref:Protein TsetseEP domain-containing protein n=2 Tax=Zootermopsis nevadensis TaxID=136037 RepID=A0A067R2P0_ZOONE|nr:hypothetical protein L798_08849 [Zootermopsis nevadensis]
MNAKIIIIALCAAQFAAAQENGFISYFRSIIDDVQTLEQQYTQSISKALNAGESEIESLLQQLQNQQANVLDKLNISDSAPEVIACIQQEEEKATEVANDAYAQLQAAVVSQSEDAQVYINKAKDIGKQVLETAEQIAVNLSVCRDKGIFTTITCLPNAIVKATVAASVFRSKLQEVLDSAQSSISQLASTLSSSVQTYTQNAAQQLNEISEDFNKCIENAAANSTSSEPASPNE